MVSQYVYDKLCQELDAKVRDSQQAVKLIQERNQNIANDEIRMARARLIAAEKSSVQRSANEGIISMHMAERLLAEADQQLDEQIRDREAEGSVD